MSYNRICNKLLIDGVSAADLSGEEGIAVDIDSNNKIAKAAASVVPDGVLMAGGDASGDVVTVYPLAAGGEVKVKIGATVAIGDLLTPQATSAEWIPGTSGDIVTMRARQAGADGNRITAVPLMPRTIA
jgi:hypothetical protein